MLLYLKKQQYLPHLRLDKCFKGNLCESGIAIFALGLPEVTLTVRFIRVGWKPLSDQ